MTTKLHILRDCQTPTPRSTMVFVHGFMGDAHDWQPIRAQMAAQHDCIFVDLPGHGESALGPGNGPWDVRAMAKSVVGLLDELELERVDLVGYSMGGRIALHLALDDPERVRRLVLESASPGIEDAAERAARAQLDTERARRMRDDPAGFIDDWYALPLFASFRDHPDFHDIVARRKQGRPDDLARVIEEMSPGRQPSLWTRLAELQMPCLMLAGQRDPKYVTIVERAAALCLASRIIAPSAGHNVHLEQPHWFAKQVSAFLLGP